MPRTTCIVLIALFIIPCISNAGTIDVKIKGIDDGVKTSRQQDYKESVLFAKREAIERAGIKIKALTTVKDFVIYSDYIESKAEAVLLPGYEIIDVGYQKDGTYLIILIGKVRTKTPAVKGIQTETEAHSNSLKRKPYLNRINPEVQLKENSWVKIIKEFVIEKTPEEHYSHIGDKALIESLIKNDPGRIFKNLHVNIQFLKYCKATKKESTFDEKGISSEEVARRFAYHINNIVEFSLPRFKCDYRTKVFVTFFSHDGHEIKTLSEIPIALWEDSSHQKRKVEMFPGEVTQISFLIPDEAKDWYVWVPK